MIDTAETISNLSKKLKDSGGKDIYVCASHGLFTGTSMELINKSPIKKVFVSNTLPLPPYVSPKIEQVTIAEMLSHVIVGEHFRSLNMFDDVFEIDQD